MHIIEIEIKDITQKPKTKIRRALRHSFIIIIKQVPFKKWRSAKQIRNIKFKRVDKQN